MPAVTILTGPIRSGKTTRLERWVAGRGAAARDDAAGLLQPDGPDGRLFVDIATGEAEPLEPVGPGEGAVAVGRFRFRAAAFDWANARLVAAARESAAWLLVDEVGPLELRGEGLRPGLDAALARPGGMLLVVRDTLVADVRAAFGLQDARVVPASGWPQVGQGAIGAP